MKKSVVIIFVSFSFLLLSGFAHLNYEVDLTDKEAVETKLTIEVFANDPLVTALEEELVSFGSQYEIIADEEDDLRIVTIKNNYTERYSSHVFANYEVENLDYSSHRRSLPFYEKRSVDGSIVFPENLSHFLDRNYDDVEYSVTIYGEGIRKSDAVQVKSDGDTHIWHSTSDKVDFTLEMQENKIYVPLLALATIGVLFTLRYKRKFI
ncbi:hypothetical protein [Evansella halocellulosilytica]|uniref:hypothetical protein n=1 Tax=Evansella halocellulosilytica TaxID=2011013 RepID=UPI0011559FD0|nr:hypothetical protein [Evansella halocellulosilytica]